MSGANSDSVGNPVQTRSLRDCTGTVTESYAYDDQGRRIVKVGAGGTAHYLYNGDDIHAECGLRPWRRDRRAAAAAHRPAATQAAYGLGSVVGLANTAGTLTANQRFDAWRNKTASSSTVPQYGYTGRATTTSASQDSPAAIRWGWWMPSVRMRMWRTIR
jgi:hypothetical protein